MANISPLSSHGLVMVDVVDYSNEFHESQRKHTLECPPGFAAEPLDLTPLSARRNTMASPCAMAYISLQQVAAEFMEY